MKEEMELIIKNLNKDNWDCLIRMDEESNNRLSKSGMSSLAFRVK